MLAEIEEKVYASKDAVVMASKNTKKEAELSAAASAAASAAEPKAPSVVVDPEDDFEEFTPVTD